MTRLDVLLGYEWKYSLSWRPGERSALALRSSAFVNEPIRVHDTHTHTYTRVYKRCTHESSVARVERRLPRERELLLSLKGDWTSCNDRRGRSKFTRSYSLSLSLSRGSIAELFSSMKGLTRDRIRVRTNTPARFIGHFGWSMMFHLSFFFFSFFIPWEDLLGGWIYFIEFLMELKFFLNIIICYGLDIFYYC